MLCEMKQLDPAKLIPALMRYEELPQPDPATAATGASQPSTTLPGACSVSLPQSAIPSTA